MKIVAWTQDLFSIHVVLNYNLQLNQLEHMCIKGHIDIHTKCICTYITKKNCTCTYTFI